MSAKEALSGFAKLSLVAGLLLSSQHASAFEVFFVGADADCPFNNIQDAIDAAAAVPGTDYVWLAMNQTYSGENVYISDPDGVIVEGGFVDCDDNDIDTAETTVSGAGNDGSAVFTIRGNSSVYFGNLFITGAARDGGASGGGIDFDGTGGLYLHESSVSLNSAGYGAGINVKGDGGHVGVVLENDTVLLRNTAQTSGGGVRIEGDTSLYVLQPNIFIAFNDAPGGYGGGIEVLGPAAAYVGSPGYNGAPVIYGNTASYGGGIAVVGSGDFDLDAYAALFTTDPQNPVQVSNNFASHTGGAVYMTPTVSAYFDGDHWGLASMCAFDFRMDDNVAQEGTAIYGDTDSYNLGLDHLGSVATLTTLSSQGCDYDSYTQTNLGEVACADGIACNTMDDNIAEDGNNQPTPGSTILMQTESSLTIYGLQMQGNQGQGAVRGLDTWTDIQNCLLTDSQFSGAAMYFQNDDYQSVTAVLRGCTLANNVIGGASVIATGRDLSLYTSIIDQPGVATLAFTDASNFVADYLLAADLTGLPMQDNIVQGSPLFVDASSADYHLQRTSLGVDFAPNGGGIDLDRRPHDVDLADVANVYGPRDLGAYEIQTQPSCSVADTLFCNGFEP